MFRRLIERLSKPSTPPSSPAVKRTIAFVTNVAQPIQVQPESKFDSELASTRLRVHIPARELAKHTSVWLVPYGELLRDPYLAFLGSATTAVLGKLSAGSVLAQRDLLEGLLAKLSAERSQLSIFADLTDDYRALGKLLNEPIWLAEYQRQLGQVAKLIVCSPGLAVALRNCATRGLHVIDDPFESTTAAEPRAPRDKPLRLLWFGNFAMGVFPFITASLAAIVEQVKHLNVELEFITRMEQVSLVADLEEILLAQNPKLRFRFTAWSLVNTELALERCDIVLLPQEHESDYGRVKSSNRLVSAIRGGRFAVASPIAAYQELEKYAWVNKDLAKGVLWALAHPDQARERIDKGQKYVSVRFSPETIGKQWRDVLGIPPS